MPPSSQPPTSRAQGYSLARRKEASAGYLLVAPFVLLFVAMLIAPLVYSAYLSLFRQQLVGGTQFIGLDNYVRALTDSVFLDGVARMALFLVVQVPVMLMLSLTLALVLDSGAIWLMRFTRLSVFAPYAVPSVIAALMWGYLYGRDFGPFAQLARALGLDTPDFLSNEAMLYSIMNIVTWSFVGYNMIILYASLRSIPAELYEAARIDGASELRIALAIKIPALRPTLVLTSVFSIIGSFQLFNEPNILRNIAPNVIGNGYTPNLYAYHLAFSARDMNYAAAIAFLLGVVIMAASFAFRALTNRKEDAS